MAYFADRGVCNQCFEWQNAAQFVVIVHDIYVVNLVHVLGLHAHLLYAFGHRPVFVDHDHLRAHQTAGGVLVIFEEVDDVAGLLHVVDMREDFVAVVLVELLYKVNGLVGFEVVNHLLSNFFCRHVGEELVAVLLVEFHQHIGSGVLVEKVVQKFRFLDVEFLVKFGDIGRVHVLEDIACLGLVVPRDNVADLLNIFFSKFFHC